MRPRARSGRRRAVKYLVGYPDWIPTVERRFYDAANAAIDEAMGAIVGAPAERFGVVVVEADDAASWIEAVKQKVTCHGSAQEGEEVACVVLDRDEARSLFVFLIGDAKSARACALLENFDAAPAYAVPCAYASGRGAWVLYSRVLFVGRERGQA